MRYLISLVLLCAMITGFAQSSLAQSYPDRPIKMLTMVGPGAQIDLLTRAVSDALSTELGKPVLVTNMPGGSHGSVMAAELKAARPDGYTLGVSATAAFTYTPHYVTTNYKFDDFEYLSLLGLNQSGIVCAPGRPWNTLKEAFEWARKEKKGLTYMFQGSDDRDVMRRIAAQEGVNLSLMPSTGGPSIISAVMGGHVDLGHLGAILFEYVKAGRLKLLAATTPNRLTQLQDVPTLREQGWNESVEMFVVLVAPKGLPAPVMARLEKALDSLKANEKLQQFITGDLVMAPVPFGKSHVQNYMKEANERFAKQAMEMKKLQ